MDKEDYEKVSEDEPQDIQNTRKWSILLIIKITLFILCLSGFSYQALEFVDYFSSNPTVIDLKVDRRKNYTIPAVTYCFVNRIAKTNFCENNPESCEEVNCNEFPNACKSQIPNATLNNASISLVDLIDLRTDIPNIMIWNPWSNTYPSIHVHGPHYYASMTSLKLSTCYTLNSLVDSREEPQTQAIDTADMKEDKFIRNFVGYFYFKWTELNEIKDQSVEGIHFHIHSPYDTGVPPADVVLKAGKRYEVVMTLKEETLLPAPYGTDCMNYTKQWKGDKSKPRSEKICKELCGVQYDLLCEGCINILNLFPHSEDQKCFRGFKYDFMTKCNASVRQKYKDCVKDCKMECLQLKYKYTITELVKDAWDYRGYHPDYIQMDFYVKPEILVYTHRPQFNEIELFSYIGGYMGIWLGISLFALANIIKSVCKSFRPWMLQIREVKKSGSFKNWSPSMLLSDSVKRGNDMKPPVNDEANDEVDIAPEVKNEDA